MVGLMPSRSPHTLKPNSTLNPKPQSLKPTPYTLIQTLNPKPQSLDPTP